MLLFQCENVPKKIIFHRCETTGFLLQCAVKESKRHGWKPTQILEIVQNIFINNHVKQSSFRKHDFGIGWGWANF